jgi:predicted dehydrogenase
MTKTIIIGCGRMGRRHISAIQNLNHEIIGVIDPFQESLDLVVSENGVSKEVAFKTLDEALSKEIPNLAVIATTADSHYEYTIKLAQAGIKNILCEKPMAVSISQCEEMLEECEKAGAKLAINHPVRFTEADIEIKKLINSDKFGGLSAINISAGNFGLAMNASHNLEMFRFLTDELPVSVQAWFDEETVANPRGPQFVDRSGALRVKTRSGKVMTINAYGGSGHGIIITYTARNGQIALNPITSEAQITVRKEEHSDKPTTQYAMPADNYTQDFKSSDLIVRCEKMVKALLADENYPDGETIKRTIEILNAAYVSAENGNIEIDVENYELDKDRIFPWA